VTATGRERGAVGSRGRESRERRAERERGRERERERHARTHRVKTASAAASPLAERRRPPPPPPPPIPPPPRPTPVNQRQCSDGQPSRGCRDAVGVPASRRALPVGEAGPARGASAGGSPSGRRLLPARGRVPRGAPSASRRPLGLRARRRLGCARPWSEGRPGPASTSARCPRLSARRDGSPRAARNSATRRRRSAPRNCHAQNGHSPLRAWRGRRSAALTQGAAGAGGGALGG
jgi:hypothetical protein